MDSLPLMVLSLFSLDGGLKWVPGACIEEGEIRMKIHSSSKVNDFIRGTWKYTVIYHSYCAHLGASLAQEYKSSIWNR